ncbi:MULTISPECIES: anthrax toxin-like adenylyl cyclase domain-containing protein [unclassified Burkholderia]|uniref:anthrax toxin-like adenylyl cyclase domain-containing protein n=1 Tax=unclassified Burkholderia TaxID=2613784 RepID=UPI000A4D9D39|nr:MULTISPECIES: anthrax toxin-like adenylyl cyclase domain-containing protein [unclassified Burkholderia]
MYEWEQMIARRNSNQRMNDAETDSSEEATSVQGMQRGLALGIDASFHHPENGMSKRDMEAASKVADILDEVIMFRSTGPWSLRWIEAEYPTKNFHVKGKSSDWGPQAGLVPYDGRYSKVGHSAQRAAAGTKANQDGINDNYARTTQLTLSREMLERQLNELAGRPARRAIYRMEQLPASKDLLLFARRSGDDKEFCFRAVPNGDVYKIWVYPEELGTDARRLTFERPLPLMVMTSSEVGARNRAMTGDYDLMAICPRWGNYGSASVREISKPGLVFAGVRGQQPGQLFPAGMGLDKVLDMRTNTGARPRGGVTDATFQGLTKKDAGGLEEHSDMGNISPRILRTINELNKAMNATGANSPFRRVHHNAESHRNHIFGAITRADMEKGEGFPITVFQPRFLQEASSSTQKYRDVSTLETLSEFEKYVELVNKMGYFVPRNWTWGMSIRDLKK